MWQKWYTWVSHILSFSNPKVDKEILTGFGYDLEVLSVGEVDDVWDVGTVGVQHGVGVARLLQQGHHPDVEKSRGLDSNLNLKDLTIRACLFENKAKNICRVFFVNPLSNFYPDRCLYPNNTTPPFLPEKKIRHALFRMLLHHHCFSPSPTWSRAWSASACWPPRGCSSWTPSASPEAGTPVKEEGDKGRKGVFNSLNRVWLLLFTVQGDQGGSTWKETLTKEEVGELLPKIPFLSPCLAHPSTQTHTFFLISSFLVATGKGLFFVQKVFFPSSLSVRNWSLAERALSMQPTGVAMSGKFKLEQFFFLQEFGHTLKIGPSWMGYFSFTNFF